MWRRTRAFIVLGPRRQCVLLEAATLVAFATIATRVLPFRLTRSLYGVPRRTTDATVRPEIRRDRSDVHLRDVTWALRVVARFSREDRGCLARALAGRVMLRRRGFAPTLVIGARRGTGDAMHLHAWLLEQGSPVIGARGANQFSTLAVFDAE